MRVGLVTACYKPVINGVTQTVSQYKDGLEACGHQVTVFTLGSRDACSEERGIIYSPALPLGSSGYHFAVRYSSDAQTLMSEMDIIHCHHLVMGLELAHRYSPAPIVFTNHTRYDVYLSVYSPLSRTASDAIMRWFWPYLTDFADAIIAPSESMRRLLHEFGVRKPVEVIYNGIPLEAFNNPSNPLSKQDLGIPENGILLVYVGRLSAEKNLLQLLEEFAIALIHVPNLYMVLIGDGPQADVLRSRARKLEVEARIRFTGLMDYADIPNALAAADIFATCSRSEVHPLTVLEAMASGLPVVAIKGPGITDTIKDGKTGLLSPDEGGELAKGIVSLSQDHELRSRMGFEARKAAAKYDIRTTVRETIALYERLLANYPPRSRRPGKHRRGWANLSGYLPRAGKLVTHQKKASTIDHER